MIWVGSAALALLAVGGLAAWTRMPGGIRANPNDAAQVALNKALYAQYCASCHGVNLEDQPEWRERKPDGKMPAPPHDATGHTWHHPDNILFGITKQASPLTPRPGARATCPRSAAC
jgi:hypothetical protein